MEHKFMPTPCSSSNSSSDSVSPTSQEMVAQADLVIDNKGKRKTMKVEDKSAFENAKFFDKQEKNLSSGASEDGKEAKRDVKRSVFICPICKHEFSTSQALGGHQNAHRRERALAKRRREIELNCPMTTSFYTIPHKSTQSQISFLGSYSNQPQDNLEAHIDCTIGKPSFNTSDTIVCCTGTSGGGELNTTLTLTNEKLLVETTENQSQNLISILEENASAVRDRVEKEDQSEDMDAGIDLSLKL